MHRIQILLEQEQYRLLNAEARRKGISLSGLIRTLINQHFVDTNEPASDPLETIAGIGFGTGDPVGREHNRYLYPPSR